MNYSPEQETSNSNIAQIIQRVFNISGVKLTADDPIVAVLLLQEKNQSSAFVQLQAETQKLLDSVSQIKKYREQVLIELMNETKRTSEQSEEKMIGLLSKYLVEFESAQRQVHYKMKTSRYYFFTVGVVGIVIGMVLRSVF